MNIYKKCNAVNIEGCKVKDLTYLSKILGLSTKYLRRYPNWYLVEGELYYFKSYVDPRKILNELIGEELCKIFNLPCVHYEIAFDGKNYGLISKNMMSKTYKTINDYGLVTDNFYQSINFLSLMCSDNTLEKQLKRMIVMDIYMMQTDRDCNIFFDENKNNIVLAPLLDFEKSFRKLYDYYFSFAFKLKFIEDKKMINKDQYLMNYFELATNIIASEILDKIKKDKNLIIKDYYEEYDKKTNNVKSSIKEKILMR